MQDREHSIKYENQARMLANRSEKTYNHFRKRFARQHIDVFRLYDWDIPEIRAAVDWYAGHLVIAEYTRKQSTRQWLPVMAAAVAEALGVSPKNVHLKERRAGKQEGQPLHADWIHTDRAGGVRKDLKFYVNLKDYIDTGETT
ncbi:MAG: hypothetical protein R2875_09780 [Desulfobacterales bacterium]